MPNFNKRHYEAIATVLQACKADMPQAGTTAHALDCVTLALADTFSRDNDRFDRGRFLHACKPGSNVKAKTAHLKAAA